MKNMSMTQIRYGQEQRIADRLLSSIQIASYLHARRMQSLEESRNNNSLSERLKKQFIELNPILTPGIYELYSQVASSLGMSENVTIFCDNDSHINASMTIEPAVQEDEEDTYILVITSEALERLEEAELRYLIGHELGHILYAHHTLNPVGALVKTGKDSEEDQPKTGLPILTERDFLQWKVTREISCDRAGLVACGSLESAILTTVKSCSNISSSLLTREVGSIISYMEGLCRDHVDSKEAFSSHPYLPVRIVSLAAFARCEDADDLQEIDRLIDSYFSSMARYPSSALDEAVMKTLAITGLAIIRHRGEVREEQLNGLVEILYSNFTDDPATQIDWACRNQDNQQLSTYLSIINDQAVSRIKLFIIYNLCRLALLDGDFDRKEQEFISSIGQRLLLSNSEIKGIIISTIQNEGLKVDPNIKKLLQGINELERACGFTSFVQGPSEQRQGGRVISSLEEMQEVV